MQLQVKHALQMALIKRRANLSGRKGSSNGTMLTLPLY